jgi:branched-chain amino acid transport system substrate-binding protein
VGPSSTITEKYKVPMIEAAGNAAPLFKRGFKYLFCTLRPVEAQAMPYMRLLARQSPKPKTVAIIAARAPYYLSSAEGYKAAAEKYGFEVVHYETYPLEMEDITPILQKVKAKNPDIFCVGSHAVVTMMVMKLSKQMNFNPKAYCFSAGADVPDFARELGKDAEFVMQYLYLAPSAPYSDPLFGTSKQFFESFKNKYGFPPVGTPINAAAAGLVFQAAIQRAGATPPFTEEKRIKVREEMAKLDITTAAGPIKFDPTGLEMANPLGLFQIQKGTPKCIDPQDWAEANFIYPVPPWSQR